MKFSNGKPQILLHVRKILLCCGLAVIFSSGVVHAETITFRLQDLVTVNPISLRCVSNNFNISLPIPERWSVKSATMEFNYVNSTTLVKSGSQLVVRFNDVVVGQRKLDPEEPEGRMKVSFPVGKVDNDYNKVSFQVAQHFTYECEQPCDPNLWSDVLLENSFITVEYEMKELPMQLSKIPIFLFDPKQPKQGKVNFVIPQKLKNAEDGVLTVAAVLASGISNQFDYLPVDFTVTDDIVPGVDNILIGDEKTVTPFLREKNIEADIKGPYVKVTGLPTEDDVMEYKIEHRARMLREYGGRYFFKQDPRWALIIVTGLNMDHLHIAAETLATLNFPYPGVDAMTITKFEMPEIATYTGRKMIETGKNLKLSKFDYTTHTFLGLQPMPLDVSFRLPPDFLIKPNQYAKVSLNFSYSGGLRVESGLNVLVNGTFATVIHLSEPKGATIEGYEVDLPTYLFKPGMNVVKFKPILTPKAGECELIQPDSLFLTIFDNSTLLFPSMPHFVQMPRMDLFMINGYPFTRWPDGYKAMAVLAEQKKPIFEALLNTVGMIAQKNGYPLFAFKVAKKIPEKWQGDMMFFGTVPAITDSLIQNTIIRLKTKSIMKYPVSKTLPEEVFTLSNQISGFGPTASAVLEFESPLAKNQTAIVFTGQTPEAIGELGQALNDGAVQGMFKKDFTIIDFLEKPRYRTASLEVSKKYYVGVDSIFTRLRLFMYLNETAFYVWSVILAIFLGLTIFLLYLNRKKRSIMMPDKGGTPGGSPKKVTALDTLKGLLGKLFIQKSGKDDKK